MRNIKIYSGSSNPGLVERVCKFLSVPTASVKLGRFANAETQVEVRQSVRNEDVFIFQSGGCRNVNDHVLELIVMINACKVASAKRVVAVMPYMPYSKQCKKKSRSGVTAQLIAAMLKKAGVSHILSMDLHAEQIEGFFDVPVDNLMAGPLIVKYLTENLHDFRDRAVVVSKNAGGVKRATALADRLGVAFAVIHKEQHLENVGVGAAAADEGAAGEEDSGPKTVSYDPAKGKEKGDKDRMETVPSLVLAGRVEGKVALIVDDMLDTASSYVQAANHCKANGATQVFVVVTHNIMSGKAVKLVNECASIDRVITTNSIPQDEHVAKCPKLVVLDASPIFAEAVRRIHNAESISWLFNNIPF